MAVLSSGIGSSGQLLRLATGADEGELRILFVVVCALANAIRVKPTFAVVAADHEIARVRMANAM